MADLRADSVDRIRAAARRARGAPRRVTDAIASTARGAPGGRRAARASARGTDAAGRRTRSRRRPQWIEQRALALLDAGIAPSLARVINATGVDPPHESRPRAARGRGARAHRRGRGGLRQPRIRPRRRRARAPARARRAPARRRSPAPRPRSSSTTTPPRRCSCWRRSPPAARSIVSRGELVEIGGGFRVPDVMAQSGAIAARSRHDQPHARHRLRRGDRRPHGAASCACIRRTSASKASPSGRRSRELAALAHRFSLPLFEDLGSGWLGLDDVRRRAGARATSRRSAQSLAAGADLVAFSGDKLLGGPQAGIVVGRRDLIERVRTAPADARAARRQADLRGARGDARAVGAGAGARRRFPLYRMLTMTVDEIERARAGARRARSRRIAGVTLPRHRRRLDDRRRQRAGSALADEARRASASSVSHRVGAGSAGCARQSAGGRADSTTSERRARSAHGRRTTTRTARGSPQRDRQRTRRASAGSNAAESGRELRASSPRQDAEVEDGDEREDQPGERDRRAARDDGPAPSRRSCTSCTTMRR